MFNSKFSVVMAAAVAMVSLTAVDARAEDKLRVTGGDVTVVCPLTVGGSFQAKTKAVAGEVGPAPKAAGAVEGSLLVKLDTLETGISMRDRHMRENYLEVGKGDGYHTAVLSNITIDNANGKGTFKGTLTLHGQTREIVGTSVLQQKDGGVQVEAQFPVKVSEFQIPKPSYLGVGVRDEVQIKVNLSTAPVSTVASSR
jgi:polyisoprenoid-binding protein YceI